jgi:hypothetical protein
MNKLMNLKPKRRALRIANANQRAFLSKVLFEDFLRRNSIGGNEFRLVISRDHQDGTLEFYCHPFGRDGETFNGYATGTEIYPKSAIDNLMKYLNETPAK